MALLVFHIDMETKVFRTAKAMVLPMGAVLLLSLALLGTMIIKGDKGFAIVVICLLLPLSVVFFSWLRRRIEVDEKGMLYSTLFRKKRIEWDSVKDLRLFTAGLKKVLYLDDGEKVVLIPMVMEKRGEFIRLIKDRLREKDLPEGAFESLEHTGFWAEPLFLWVAVAALALILLLRLR